MASGNAVRVYRFLFLVFETLSFFARHVVVCKSIANLSLVRVLAIVAITLIVVVLVRRRRQKRGSRAYRHSDAVPVSIHLAIRSGRHGLQ
jgi:Flp pilus assembly protein TadB